ncbi:helix-turn-helix transcriptional regulator [Jeongeupia chitinilytica]|uniref:Transcriptional regulator n=1 Tax=Jeongeupia chitinilytica TaxID=1041641 RepID=A0ABQ3GYM5_9NEIS|nr:helix-turn-helix transcriptional regulator [Jeongeupia chitinilytica]GHD59053.1 transcriptional regulator [Jeongeupia chitinilytica]
MSVSASIRRKELGDFLMSLRQQREPAAFGFAAGLRRRTAGLRREEVAQLCDISPTWYTWIEQGRDISVSADALDRLAVALRMDRSQRAYLFELAGRHDPQQPRAEHDVSPGVIEAAVRGFAGPAYVLGRRWDVLAWNDAAARLFGPWLAADAAPNLLDFVFLDQAARTLVVDWEVRARRLAAEFRADTRAGVDDAGLIEQVAQLSQSSPEFAEYWRRHDVLERQGGERTFAHPDDGLLVYHQLSFKLVDHEALKLVLLTPLDAR